MGKDAYLKKRADKWVSVVVLLGCVVITGVLVYTAFKAQAIGGKLADYTISIE